MRILITRRESFHLPDGINIFIFTLADELVRRGHDVVALSTCRTDENIVRDTFTFQYYPHFVSITDRAQLSYTQTGIAWLRAGRARAAECSPDAVIINGAVPVRLPGRSAIVSHDLEQRLADREYLRVLYKRWTYRLPQHVVATCSELAVALAHELRLDPAGITVIPTCMRIGNYRGKPLEERRKAILHMGTVGYKNPLATLRAFITTHAAGDSELILTGPITAELQQEYDAAPREVQLRIQFVGFVSAEQLKELIESARLVSVPSVYHVPVASPTVLEAFAASTPVVCSNSISRDIIQDGVNSLKADSADDLAGAFNSLLTDDELWRKLSNETVKTAGRYSAENVAMRYEALLK
jgi:glycosyltransferase involved in cell wall biosynthesis